jgi:hypothetical protein
MKLKGYLLPFSSGSYIFPSHIYNPKENYNLSVALYGHETLLEMSAMEPHPQSTPK